MIAAETAISRVRRDLTLGFVLKVVLVLLAVSSLIVPSLFGINGGDLLLLLAVGGIWMFLSYRSIQSSRVIATLPQLIATGQYHTAEQQIEQSLRSFSFFRTVKLLSMHHLAVLRHAQRRWQDAATLSRALLRQRLGNLKGIDKQSRLILADALLEMGDLPGAHDALSALYDQRPALSEALNLLSVQLDYQSRVGDWSQMAARLPVQVQLAELMPTPAGARAQALLALAARKTGQIEWSHWLRRRVELLVDVQELCSRRPMLWELWEPDADEPADDKGDERPVDKDDEPPVDPVPLD